jgi:hypothetical protein
MWPEGMRKNTKHFSKFDQLFCVGMKLCVSQYENNKMPSKISRPEGGEIGGGGGKVKNDEMVGVGGTM